jgi:integrase
LIDRFRRQFVEIHYRHPNGTPTSEVENIKSAVRALRLLYGATLADEFGPKRLTAVRDAMVKAGLARPTINARVRRIVRMFKWAVSAELVPAEVYGALRSVSGLRAGRTTAPEPEPIGPVPVEDYETTLPRLPRVVRAMAELQRFTGMRPGEVCGLRLGEVDRTGPIWLYEPSHHKTAHHGKARVVAIGPKAQAVLLAFLAGRTPAPDGIEAFDLTNPTARIAAAKLYEEAGRPVDADLLRDESKAIVFLGGSIIYPAAFLFNPSRDRAERFAAMRQARKTTVQPSQRNRRQKNAKRQPGERFTTAAFGNAIGRACRAHGIEVWSPNQLRHLFASEVRKLHGLEAAQVALGHATANVTQIYAERDQALAVRVASVVG